MSIQVLINGLATGAVYALIATGFALIFNVLKFSNFSHGATMTVAAFVAYFLVSAKGYGIVPTLIIGALAGGLVAFCGEFIGFRRILKIIHLQHIFLYLPLPLGRYMKVL